MYVKKVRGQMSVVTLMTLQVLHCEHFATLAAQNWTLTVEYQ